MGSFSRIVHFGKNRAAFGCFFRQLCWLTKYCINSIHKKSLKDTLIVLIHKKTKNKFLKKLQYYFNIYIDKLEKWCYNSSKHGMGYFQTVLGAIKNYFY